MPWARSRAFACAPSPAIGAKGEVCIERRDGQDDQFTDTFELI
jgi:hypothetical protein